MSELLSGFIGAVIATLLSVLYFFISEQKKLRSDVMLEVVGYCDDIYRRLQDLHVHKGTVYTQNSEFLTPEEYRVVSRELISLLTSARTRAKLALVHGEGSTLAAFNGLQAQFQKASSIVRGATRSAWHQENASLHRLFAEEIDPRRAKFERLLLEKTRAFAIVMGFFKQCILAPYNLAKKLRRQS